MEQREIQVLEELAKSLSLLSTKGTVTATEAKIKAIQVEKNIEKISMMRLLMNSRTCEGDSYCAGI